MKPLTASFRHTACHPECAMLARSPLFIAALLLCLSALSGWRPAHGQLADLPEVLRASVPPPSIKADSWLLADYATGWIIAGANADERIIPASLTKIMTSYVVFEALHKGEIKFEDMVYVSEKAWRTGGSKMFIRVDTQVSIEALIQGLIVQSGNDAAVALAEHIGGSEEGFASRMNLLAAELGMTRSNFTNSSGLPEENHYSTLRDITVLSIALIRTYPELYKYYSQLEYTYNDITQQNRNILLHRDPTVDGIKTGYTREAGYGLMASAVRDDIRLLAAVSGADGRKSRADQVQALLQYGYGAYDGLIAYKPGDVVQSIPLWMGRESEAEISVNRPLGVIFPKGKADNLSAVLELPDGLDAPLDAGAAIGHIQIKYDGEPVLRSALYTRRAYTEGPWYSKLLDVLKKWVF